MPAPDISDEHLRRLAALARLTLAPDEAPRLRDALAGIIRYVDQLRALDLAGVEPLVRVGDTGNRLDDDTPGATLPPGALRAMAPAMHDDFIAVPKVLGDGGGA